DVGRALAEADVVVDGEYRTQTVLHNAMETHQSVCRWEGDTLEVYTSTQYIWGIRDEVSEALSLPRDKVRVVCNFMGGGFGAKNSPGDYTFIAIALAGQTGAAVRCALTRREENLVSGNRNSTIQRLVAGARSDGTLTALSGDYINAIGWDGFSGPTYGPMEMLYDCENVRTQTFGAKLNTPPNAAFRAPGFVEGTFRLECALDALAAKLDLDPLELRRRNYADHDLVESARGPFASISAGSSTTPSMGPAVRAAAGDAKRQLVEIAAERCLLEERVLEIKDGQVISADGGSWPVEEVTGLLEDAQILGKGARGPNPTGMRVLTFGIQVAEVAVDVETGEVRVERIAAIHDVGRIINPLGAKSQVEGGIIQGLGHTLSEERLLDPQSGGTLTQTLDAYKLPTIADVPEIVTDLLDIPDEHLTNLGSKRLGEPPIVPTAAAIVNAIRD